MEHSLIQTGYRIHHYPLVFLMIGVLMGGLILEGCLQKVPRACRTSSDCMSMAPAIFCDEGHCRETQCQPGQQENCYDGSPATLGKGICRGGTRTCTLQGRWSACLGQQLPQREFCDKLDNDCDGTIDNVTGESCHCSPPGQKRLCYSAAEQTTGVGTCKAGVQYCERDFLWGHCLGSVQPEPEICNGFDDDCNGLIDDHPSCSCEHGQRRSCYPGDPLLSNKGRCKPGVQICERGQWLACTGFVLPRPEGEDCSTPDVDDNCDGQVNEGCQNVQKCPGSQSLCGQRCIDVQQDTQHCGQCDRACSHDRECRSGLCVCPSGLSSCDPNQPCIDINTHAQHCGACGRSCGNLESCCNGVCVNTQNHAQHCGACGRLCPVGYACQNGTCAVECSSGQTRCADTCIDLQTERYHCGTCGNVCRSEEICRQGICQCPNPTQNCNGVCVDLNNDAKHCGGCDRVCSADQYCTQGACVCGQGLTMCSNRCVNLSQDTNHCGQCGQSCGANQFCKQGTCEPCPQGSVHCGSSCCPQTLTCCNNQACVDLKTDPVFCGSCQQSCVGHQYCNRQGSNPVCQCREGTVTRFYGGSLNTRGQGTCRDRIVICRNGQEIELQSEQLPVSEQCNGLDDDCDGQIDETNDMVVPLCPKQKGVCAGSKPRTCLGSKGWLPCQDSDYLAHHKDYQVRETACDGLDNDCDGQVDEPEDLAKLKLCTNQLGVCLGQYQRCLAGTWTDCDTPFYQKVELSCDNLDNNCDGTIDEGLNCHCIPSAPLASFTAHGTETVVAISFHPTLPRMATASGLDIRIWDVSTRKTLRVIVFSDFSLPNRLVSRIAWSPDGALLAVATTSSSQGVWLFHAVTGQFLKRFVFQSTATTKPDETQPLVVFSPDGRSLLTGTGNLRSPFASQVVHPLVLWDVATGSLLQTYPGHEKGVLDIGFHPQGQSLISCGYDKKVVIWDIKTTTPTRVFTEAQSVVRSVDWSRDGQVIAAGLDDGQIIFWKEQSTNVWSSQTVSAHLSSIALVRFRPNRRILASMSDDDVSQSINVDDDRSIRLWDVDSTTLLRTMYGHARSLQALAWQFDGLLLASSSAVDLQTTDSGNIRLWGCPAGCDISQISNPLEVGSAPQRHTQAITALTFHSDGTRFASASKDGTVHVWSIEGNQRIHAAQFTPSSTPPVATGLAFSALAFAPQDLFLLAVLDNKERHVWSTAFAQTVSTLGANLTLAVAFSPHRYEWFAATVADTIQLFKAKSLTQLPSSPGGVKNFSNVNVLSLAWSEDGQFLATGDANASLSLWKVAFVKNMNFASFQLYRTIPMLGTNVQIVRWHPSGSILVAGPHGNKDSQLSVKSTDPQKPDPTITLQHGDSVVGAAFSPDGGWLATVGRDKFLKLYTVQPSTGSWQIQFKNSITLSQIPTRIAWSPTGKHVIVGMETGSIFLYSCTP